MERIRLTARMTDASPTTARVAGLLLFALAAQFVIAVSHVRARDPGAQAMTDDRRDGQLGSRLRDALLHHLGLDLPAVLDGAG